MNKSEKKPKLKKSLMRKGNQAEVIFTFNLFQGLTASTTWTTTTAATTAASAGWPRRRKTAAPAAPTAAKIRPWPTTRRTNFDPEKNWFLQLRRKSSWFLVKAPNCRIVAQTRRPTKAFKTKAQKTANVAFSIFVNGGITIFFSLANAAAAFESSLDRRSSMKPMMIFAFLEILFLHRNVFTRSRLSH